MHHFDGNVKKENEESCENLSDSYEKLSDGQADEEFEKFLNEEDSDEFPDKLSDGQDDEDLSKKTLQDKSLK